MSKLLQSTKDAICAFVQSADEATVSRILPIVFPSGQARPTRQSRPERVTRNRATSADVESTIKSAGAKGTNAQAIAEALGVRTKDVVRPLRELLAAKSIRRTGKARATRYFAR